MGPVRERAGGCWRCSSNRRSAAQLVIAILLKHLYSAFYEVLVNDIGADDPIGLFLDYVTVRSRMQLLPPHEDDWWETADTNFPEQLNELERRLPECFSVLARNSGLISLLRQAGDAYDRTALRAELIRRPLGAEAVLESTEGPRLLPPPHGSGWPPRSPTLLIHGAERTVATVAGPALRLLLGAVGP